MVRRSHMTNPILQCGKNLNFKPRRPWPSALPAFAWKGELISGFERSTGLDLQLAQKATLVEAVKAAHPELSLPELARFTRALRVLWPDLFKEVREHLFKEYSLRWSERLEATLNVIASAPESFQDWASERDLGAREFSALLALPNPLEFHPFLEAMTHLDLTRSAGARALELGAELFMMGRPLNDLLPSGGDGDSYLRQLERWRRPVASGTDEQWRETVRQWPWPAQTKASWQRFGDQSGLEVSIRSTSRRNFARSLKDSSPLATRGMQLDRFDRVYIHEDSRGSALAGRVLELFPPQKIEFVKERPFPEAEANCRRGNLPVRRDICF